MSNRKLSAAVALEFAGKIARGVAAAHAAGLFHGDLRADDVLVDPEAGPKVGPYVINDPYFIYDDVSDDRHLGKCCVVYLDGHTGEIPGKLNLYYNKEYGYCH